MNGVYIHIPFCTSKCPYCDFHSQRCSEALQTEYVQALLDEITTLRRVSDFVNEIHPSDSLYLGGGTPSLLKPSQLRDIILTSKESLKLTKDCEITVECNPGSPIEELIEVFKECGVNRTSLGMQSAVDSERRLLGRVSHKARIREVISLLKENGINNISLDIMLGIPGQTKESLTETLQFIEECDIQHISSYILKIEEGTHFHRFKEKYNFPDDDASCDLYNHCCDYLENLGFIHYEISNFAKEGFQSRHNTKYWTLENYLGIGAAAHSFVDGKRFYFEKDTQAFIDGNKALFDCEGYTAEEYIMLRLRLNDGLKLSEVERLFGKAATKRIRNKAPLFHQHGLAVFDGENFRLTRNGFLISNTIISEII